MFKDNTNIKTAKLFLYNDSVNSFDHVIQSLVDVCNHDYLQAEQCAMITHNKGSYQIASGNTQNMEYLKTLLIMKGLNVVVN